MTRSLLAAALSLTVVACAAPDDVDTTASAVIGGDGSKCGVLGCSSNSAYLGPTEFHELDETGVTPNDEGFRIKSFKKNGISYRLDVTGTTLSGWTFNIFLLQWQKTLWGSALAGADIEVENVDTNDTFLIKIDRVLAQPLWQAPSQTIEAYELLWYGLGYVRQPVCANPTAYKDGDPLPASGFEAILFTGDRFNREDLTVTATTPRAAGPWFNIACANNAMFKMAAHRYVDATMTSNHITTWAMRQAMLKMYTSDIWGIGEAITKNGTALYWVEIGGLWHSKTPYSTLEARWDEHGARCLDVHRLHGSNDDMDEQIKALGGGVMPPSCASVPAGGYFTTYSPAQL